MQIGRHGVLLTTFCCQVLLKNKQHLSSQNLRRDFLYERAGIWCLGVFYFKRLSTGPSPYQLFLWHESLMAQLEQPHPQEDFPFFFLFTIDIITIVTTAISISNITIVPMLSINHAMFISFSICVNYF